MAESPGTTDENGASGDPGEVIGICGINKDFTAMKCMQDALEEERDRLKATIAELEAKNALLQADLQLARGIQEAGVTR